MTNQELWQIALQQSAYDCNCAPEDFLRAENLLTRCAAWSNVKSVRNAIRCGFRPAWVELTARDAAFVDELNRR